MDMPPSKKPKMASVLVEQNGPASNKVLIDQVTDVDANFDEVINLKPHHTFLADFGKKIGYFKLRFHLCFNSLPVTNRISIHLWMWVGSTWI